MNKRALVFLGFIFCASSMMADKVYLKSGSVLSGKAGEVSGDSIKFASDDLGVISIKLENIKSLESQQAHVVQYNDNKKESKNLSVKDGFLVEGDKKLDMTNVKAVDPVQERWHGSVNLAAGMARGNTVSESASLCADASRKWDESRFASSLGYYFSQSGDTKADKQKTENRFEIQAQEDYFLLTKLYTYLNGKFETDQIMDLDYRIRFGAGLGYQWFDSDDVASLGKISFNQELGGAWVREEYDNDYRDDFATIRYAHHFLWAFACIDNLQFIHNLEFLPDVSDPVENYLIDADAGLSWAFHDNWQLMAKFEWDYKSKVADGVKHSDLRYILALGYKW